MKLGGVWSRGGKMEAFGNDLGWGGGLHMVNMRKSCGMNNKKTASLREKCDSLLESGDILLQKG